MERIEKRKLELDDCYKQSEILELELKPLSVPRINYIIYEDESNVYFFEQLEDDMFRFHCQTSKNSFYL